MKQGFRLVAVLAMLLVLAACQAPAGAQANQAGPMELKIYAVPPAQTGRLAGALGLALGGKASVTTPAEGKLLVYAPRDAQSSIGGALADLGRTTAAGASVAQVSLHFWIVDGQAGAGADDAVLKPLTTTLDALRQRTGSLHFRLDQEATAMVSSNQQGGLTATTAQGHLRNFEYQVAPAGDDAVDLSLKYEDSGQDGLRQMHTEVGARFGEYLVLAEAPGACPGAVAQGTPAPACSDAAALRLLIVRVDRLNPRT